MTTVVCEPCYDCKYTDCVIVCPVDCFWGDESMLYIDPQQCIDCEACIPECPVGAICYEITPGSFIPPRWSHFVELNKERATALKTAGLGHVTTKEPPQRGPDCGST